MELDLPTPVSRPPFLETRPRTVRRTHPSNTRQKSAEKMVHSAENGYVNLPWPAYYDTESSTTVKSFMVQAQPLSQIIQLFFSDCFRTKSFEKKFPYQVEVFEIQFINFDIIF